MESKWQKDSLFVGFTPNAFKLGTVLTLGWFWPRITGCCLLYRGFSMESIDLDNVLTVSELDCQTIQPPSYLSHASSTIYFYVVRKANQCGDEEKTLAAAAKVVIDADGNLALVEPNDLFQITAEQSDSDKVNLLWRYFALNQNSKPDCFKIYSNNGNGQIDYQTPIAQVDYTGPVFYEYETTALQPGTYLFAVRAEDTDGTDDGSFAKVKIQLDTSTPDSISITTTETA